MRSSLSVVPPSALIALRTVPFRFSLTAVRSSLVASFLGSRRPAVLHSCSASSYLVILRSKYSGRPPAPRIGAPQGMVRSPCPGRRQSLAPSFAAVYSQHLTSAGRGTVPRHFVPRYLCLLPASFLGAQDAPCRSLPFSEPVGWCSSSDPIMRCPPRSVKSANATERGLPTTAFASAELTSRWQLTDKEYCVPHSMPFPPLPPAALGFQT